MSQEVVLPALGESVTEGTVTRWLKNVGDTVAVDEPLVEISTDKVDTEIPSPVAGVVEEIFAQEDETVEVGAVLARIGDGSASAPAPAETPQAAAPEPAPEPAPSVPEPVAVAAPAAPPAPAAPEAPAPPAAAPIVTPPVMTPPPAPPTAPAAAPVVSPPPVAPPPAASIPQPVPSGSRSMPYVTPIVRKLAHDHNVDIATVVGTGVGGRIRKEDVLHAAGAATAPPVSQPRPTEIAASPLRGTSVPMSRLRKVIAERAVASMQSSAQLTSVVEVDVTEVAELRQVVKDSFVAKTGVKLSFLPFFVKAAAEALQALPIINAVVEGETIVYPDTENISIAVDTERGLLTPVLKSAGGMNLADIAKNIADLAERTRTNQLSPDELAGGTFTVTNTGSRGALFDTPIVFLPQVAILGTGIVQKKPVVVTHQGADSIAIRHTVYLALSYDHRIVDGADAARFLTMIKDRLEAGDFDGDLGI